MQSSSKIINTIKHPTFYRPDILPVNKPSVKTLKGNLIKKSHLFTKFQRNLFAASKHDIQHNSHSGSINKTGMQNEDMQQIHMTSFQRTYSDNEQPTV